MPIIDPRNVAMSDGKFEVTVYRGAADDRTTFGVTAKALVDQNNNWEHWVGQRQVKIGDKFRRRVRGWNGADWSVRDTWEHVTLEEYWLKEPVQFNPNREVTAAAGAPMVDETGIPIFVDDDGDGKAAVRPNQPATGEAARDPRTGALTGETVP